MLILATVAVIGVGFLVYWLVQPPPTVSQVQRQRPIEVVPATRPVGAETPSIVGAGEGVWVKRFNQDTGALLSQFRGARFDPPGDGTYRVTKPEAEFFLGNGQFLRVRGQSGVIVTDAAAMSQDDLQSTPTTPPSRGELENVTIELFDRIDATNPMLTVELPNAAFDNDTFRIYTQDYRADGRTIAADQVPVKVRGVDYDFDGKGLTIRWNERNARLEFMEIAHGGRLLIKNPDKLGGLSYRGLNTATLPEMFAAADETAVAEVLQGGEPGELYRATFFDDVRIAQGDVPLVDGAVMHVDFMLEEDEADSEMPATQESKSKPAETSKKESPQKKPREKKKDEPIEVVWTGKLRLAPADHRPEKRIVPGTALVRIEGGDKPVVLEQNGQHIDCAAVLLETASQTFYAESSDRFPVHVTDPKGTTITTTAMSYSMERNVVTLLGNSRAEFPVKMKEKDEILVTEWTDACRLELNENRDAISVRQAVLTGEVVVQHPQLSLSADELGFKFNPSPADAPADENQTAQKLDIELIAARGNVDCRLRDEEGERLIQCDDLKLETGVDATGELYARRITADGNVQSADPDHQLSAGSLSVAVKPADKPGKYEVEEFEAQGDVHMNTADGATLSADQILADGKQIKLIGQPARLTEGEQRFAGPIVQILPESQEIRVLGEGTGRIVQTDKTRATTRPIDMTWKQSIVLEGKSNLIRIEGGVTITTDDDEYGTITARGDRMQVSLQEKPVAAGTETKTSAKDDSRIGFAENLDFVENKEVVGVTLSDNVQVNSIKLADDGSLKKRLALLAPVVTYSVTDGNAVVPGAGRMLYQDYVQADATDDPASPSARGDTAFAWSREMRFDELSHQATMSGDVKIVHQPENKEDRFTLNADEVVAELSPTVESDSTSGFHMRRLIARGDLTFVAADAEMSADMIEYDPETHLLIGRWDGYNQAVLTQGIQSWRAEEVQVNVKTWQLGMTNATASVRQ
jgi:hypothetical protein